MSLPASAIPYFGAVSSSLFPHLAVLLSLVGLFFLSWFFIYEVTSGSEGTAIKKNLTKELGLALAASIFLGFGTLFLLLWTGVFV